MLLPSVQELRSYTIDNGSKVIYLDSTTPAIASLGQTLPYQWRRFFLRSHTQGLLLQQPSYFSVLPLRTPVARQ